VGLNMSMLMILSPAKSLDYETPPTIPGHTLPDHVPEAQGLIDILRPMTPAQIGTLMSVSESLAKLNAGRFAIWQPAFDTRNAKQAVLAFNGDVYEGLNATALNEDDLMFAQQHVRILSGLYGLLRPLDLIQPYRLEMGTKLPNSRGKDLYAYWKPLISPALNKVLGAKSPVLVNLASDEYFKSVDQKQLKARLITPTFEDYKNDKYKIISFFAKRARGLMVRYAIVNRITDPEQLKGFDYEGYAFNAEASSEHTWVFRRKLT
jgi:cytoplasmic iron level regulating protein YaaA (DUF328/UPF0246 family)